MRRKIIYIYIYIGSHECLLLFTTSCWVSAFIICRGLCACTEMYVLYASFGSQVSPITFGCVAMCSAVLIILTSGFTQPVGTRESCKYICVWGVVVWVMLEGVGGWLGAGSGKVLWCFVCVCCECGFFVEMAGPAICVLCSADTCTS